MMIRWLKATGTHTVGLTAVVDPGGAVVPVRTPMDESVRTRASAWSRARARQAFVPRALKRGVRGIVDGYRLGWQPYRYLAGEMRRCSIGTCVDVGANVGQFAVDLREAGFGGSIISYEPNPHAFAALRRRALRDDKWTVRNAAVAVNSGVETLHISANDGLSSSLLDVTPEAKMASEGLRTVADVAVRTVTWAAVFGADDLDPSTTLVKLDCQGLEVLLLRDMHRLGLRPAGVLCEVGLRPMYDGAGDVGDLVAVVADLGLVLADIRPGFRDGDGRLLEADVLAVAVDG
jgi:FkbM family methyltransferase